uniref:Beta-glucuronidase n=1 Tax=Phallusia mammillata TaxID=59560 RepID=A0A6F9DEU0_9ASCI|nr:beta-glucuronidase-like [Phallusia mammillata]
MIARNSISLWVIAIIIVNGCFAILYPRESESRDVKDLSGRWKFRMDNSTDRKQGFTDKWWTKPLSENGPVIDMPVPSSYNDITQDKNLRDFSGWVWYETEFYVSATWSDAMTREWLRIGSAHYTAFVWLNSIKVMEHYGGHLPFESDVSNHLVFGQLNRLTVAVNNTLTPNTLPPGKIEHFSTDNGYPANYQLQTYQFDFFNYAGIHRPVKLYTTPLVCVRNITVITTDIGSNSAQVSYKIDVVDSVQRENAAYNVTVILMDHKQQTVVANATGMSGTLTVNNPRLWWPVGMSSADVGYLYKLVVYTSLATKFDNANVQTDVYRLSVGIRTVKIDGTSFLINDKPFYFLGVGKHEDWDVRGKGFDWPMILKDFNLLNWLGANAFRTSHYPYAEEIMQLCDEQGIVVIDECPAVGMHSADNFVNATLQHHLAVMDELVARDRNHPAVVMWSVANEPESQLPPAKDYFKAVIEHTHSLDSSRPVTFVCNAPYNTDLATQFVDVVSFNKYEGWYNDGGHTEVIVPRLTDYIEHWHQTRPNKPIIHMEWGAGAISGFHANPSVMYTEEYLCDVIGQHFKVYDQLRTGAGPYLVGEMIWNFADFNTAQTATRADGNRKGLMTRERQPKWPAYVVRERYHALRNQTDTSVSHLRTTEILEDDKIVIQI